MNQKRVIRCFGVFCILMAFFFSVAVLANEETQQKEGIFTYIVEDGYTTITNVDDAQAVVNIPEQLGGYPVTTLAGGAFGGSVVIEEVIIPDSVTTIESMCFSYCTELTKVILPKNLTKVAYGAFNHCSKLRTIELPMSVKTIEKDAFYRCDQLWTITIPDGTTGIGENAFAACPNLSAATIPESVTWIGEDAFQKTAGFRIYAKPGSTAETYARYHDIPFEELITVSVNGQDVVFDQPPITDTVNFRTLVPMRAVLEVLDAKIAWDEETNSSRITLPHNRLVVRVGETFMMVNGIKKDLSTPAIEYNWRTLIPIRDIIESIGGTIQWDEAKKHISIIADISLVD